MRTITLDVPDELAEQLADMRERLPELLALSLQQPAVPASVYRDILTFLASNPTPEQLAAFGPRLEVRQRLQTFLERNQAGSLTPAEDAELDELERIEHVMVMLKTGALAVLARTP